MQINDMLLDIDILISNACILCQYKYLETLLLNNIIIEKRLIFDRLPVGVYFCLVRCDIVQLQSGSTSSTPCRLHSDRNPRPHRHWRYRPESESRIDRVQRCLMYKYSMCITWILGSTNEHFTNVVKSSYTRFLYRKNCKDCWKP